MEPFGEGEDFGVVRNFLAILVTVDSEVIWGKGDGRSDTALIWGLFFFFFTFELMAPVGLSLGA